MDQNPIVSIIMSAYNSEAYISEAIESIIRQTYQNWELLVTDDCSNDNTATIIQNYVTMDHRIILLRNECNKGLTANLVHMSTVAKGEYIARLDADDISRCDRLEKQINYIKKNKCDIVCSFAKGIGDRNLVLKTMKTGEELRACLLFFNPIVHSTVMFKNDGSFKYDASFLKSQDYDLWDRMSGMGKKFGVISETLVYFRFHENQISNRYSLEQANNSDIIRSRALERISPNVDANDKMVILSWLRNRKLESVKCYYIIINIFNQILQTNKKIRLYEQSSLKKIINILKMELILSPIVKSNEKITLMEKGKVVITTLSFRSLKLLLANALEKKGKV